MEIGREIFWNVGQSARWITYALMVITFIVLIYAIKKRYVMWRIGKSTPFSFKERLGERIGYFVSKGIFHRSILKAGERYPGYMHIFIFWGFLLLAIGTALVALEDDVLHPLWNVRFLHGNFYLLFSLVLDAAGLAAIIGIVMAAIRRYITKPERLDNKSDDALALAWIFVVLVTGFLVEATRIAYDRPSFEQVSFVGYFLSSLFLNVSKEGVKAAHASLWYGHMLLSFGLIAYIAYGRLLHVITSSLNIMFRGVETTPRGAVTAIEDFETAEEFGVNQIDGYNWRQIFDLDACTRCGRCQDRCPAHLSEKPLSPKKLVQDLKGEWER
jgi:nitrate reductase gamma subunit